MLPGFVPFYHGTTAEQAALGLGGQAYGTINTAQAMCGADLGDMSHNKNPQLHMMNRTMNLPMNHGAQIDPSALLGVDPNTAASLLGGGNLNLEQALLLQTVMANGMTYDNNALTMALANEILRRNATVNQQNGNAGFDARWMNAHQMASAAARQHMNGIKMQSASAYQQSVAAAMAAMNQAWLKSRSTQTRQRQRQQIFTARPSAAHKLMARSKDTSPTRPICLHYRIHLLTMSS